jgi:CheY-like chemotaxis protein
MIDETDDKAGLLFTIIDTGIGIAKNKMKAIFDSFSQAASETTRKYGGTGLGLTICKQLVELQGGKIYVFSKENEGSNFSFSIKYGKTGKTPSVVSIENEASQIDINPEKSANTHILIVEDNHINQILTQKVLKKYHFQVSIATDGEGAIKKTSEETFDLILMDIQMPVMDGYSATKHIREDKSGKNSDVPIIALTASVFKGEREKVLMSGMNDFIAKPFNENDLIRKIANRLPYLIDKKTDKNSSETSREKLNNKVILLVEDDKINRVLAQKILNSAHIKTETAGNGNEAIQILKEKHIDMILMDIQMPGMNGYDTAKFIRVNFEEDKKNIPIIAITGASMDIEIQKCIEAGMNDCISKPYNTEELMSKIMKYIE